MRIDGASDSYRALSWDYSGSRRGTNAPAPAFGARPRSDSGGDPASDDGAPPLIGARTKGADAPVLGKRKTDDADGTRDKAQKSSGGSKDLTPDQQAEVTELRRRDAEVRAHEAAHAATAGALGGGASFDYQTGPDGKNYAVGGEVPVQMSTGRTPEETIRNAAQLRAAALAPAQPSAQDRAVAAEASALEAEARAEIAARSVQSASDAADPTQSSSDATAAAAPADAGPALTPTTTQAGATTHEQTSRVHEEMKVSERKHVRSEAPKASNSAAPDHETMMQRLETEQRASHGVWRHLHSDDGCASCRAAVSAYRFA